MKKILPLLILFPLLCSFKSLLAQTRIKDTVVYFTFDSDTLKPNQIEKLNNLISQVKNKEITYVKVFGYASPSGDDDYNQKLSENRVERVLQYLESHISINEDNSYGVGMGESPDVYDLHYDKNHAQQKAVDVLIYVKE